MAERIVSRRRFAQVAGALLLARPAMARSSRMWRIGYLEGGGEDFRAASFEELHALGYVEGQNLVFEYRSAEGRVESLPRLARELASLKPMS